MPPSKHPRRQYWISQMWRTTQEEKGCVGKTGHADRRAANAHRLALLRNRKSKPGRRLNVYACRFCGLWHVGNEQPRPRREE